MQNKSRGRQEAGAGAGGLPSASPSLLLTLHLVAQPQRSRLGQVREHGGEAAPLRPLPWASYPSLLHPVLEPRAPPELASSARIIPTPRPRSLSLPRPAARSCSGAPRHPLPSWGLCKTRPPGGRGAVPPLQAARRARLGAREGAAGAAPGYLQEESFGFGSPLLGSVELTLPLPAAEKRQRLRGAPSRPAARPSRLRAPAAPCQLSRLTSARRRR